MNNTSETAAPAEDAREIMAGNPHKLGTPHGECHIRSVGCHAPKRCVPADRLLSEQAEFIKKLTERCRTYIDRAEAAEKALAAYRGKP